MAIFGLPVEVVGGACAGISASFFTTFELESDSSLASALFKTKMRSVITSSAGSILIGVFVSPLAGITFECFFYPACWLKQKRVEKALAELDTKLEDGEEGEVFFQGEWHTVKKKLKQSKLITEEEESNGYTITNY